MKIWSEPKRLIISCEGLAYLPGIFKCNGDIAHHLIDVVGDNILFYGSARAAGEVSIDDAIFAKPSS